MKAHIDSQLAFGDSRARCLPSASGGNGMVLLTVVVISRWRTARPNAKAASTDPPSESSASVAPRASFTLVNFSKSRAVSSVIMPTAETQTRQYEPHFSTGPSVRNSKRIEVGFDSSFATERSLVSANMQTQASAETPIRCRVIVPLFSLPAFGLSAEAQRVQPRSSKQKAGHDSF